MRCVFSLYMIFVYHAFLSCIMIWWFLSHMMTFIIHETLIMHGDFNHTWWFLSHMKRLKNCDSEDLPKSVTSFFRPWDAWMLYSLVNGTSRCSLHESRLGRIWLDSSCNIFFVFFLFNFPFGDSALLECQSTMQSRCAWARKLFVTLDPCAWIVHDFESSLKR